MTIRFDRIRSEDALAISEVYARVFEGPPWFEIMKCVSCHEPYGRGDDLDRFRDGIPCRRCCEPLKLVTYWRGGDSLAVIEEAVRMGGFIGFLGRADDSIIAFSWGFRLPATDTHAVMFSKVFDSFGQLGYDPKRIFCLSEIGVLPEQQEKGIGTSLLETTLRTVSSHGFTHMTYRTIHEGLIHISKKLAGESEFVAIFKDPDPVKSDRQWYIFPVQGK